jgi:IclR family acetate operon transcriptional repressor
MDSSSGRRLQTTETSRAIIDAVNELGEARMSELADRLDVSTSTIHVHLKTLLDQEYLVKRGEQYRLGLKLFHLGEDARTRNEWYEVARRKTHELADSCGEEVTFAVEEYGRAITLFNVVANVPSKGFQVGRYYYLHNSAVGKAILAELPETRVNEILDRWGLPAETEYTITDREALMEDIERTNERGYSVNDQEAVEGLRSVGVPVTAPHGGVLGALDISGPLYRLPPNEELASMLQDVVEELESELGVQ